MGREIENLLVSNINFDNGGLIMKNFIKKGLAISLMTCLLSGCGVGASPSKNAEKADSNKKIELTMYYPVNVGGPITKVVQKLADDFTKENPNIIIKPVYTGNYDDTMIKIQTAVNSKTPPDLAVALSTELYTFLDMNSIEPLDSFIAKDGGKNYINNFFTPFTGNSKAAGKIWSIPFQRSTVVLYYNKDMFKSAGLDPDNPPKTWDDLISDSQKLTVKDQSGQVKQWGIELPTTVSHYWIYQALALQNGKNIMSSDGKKVYFDTKSSINALQNWADLSQKYNVMPKGILDWNTVPSDFIKGKTAMMYHTTGNLTNVKNNANFKFGVAFLPAQNKYGTPTGGGNLYMFKNISDEKKQAAWKFIKWVTAPERAAQWSIDTGYVATEKSSYDTDLLKNYIKDFPQAEVAKDQLKYASPELSVHNNGQIYKIIDDAVQSAVIGNTSAENALKKAQKDATDALKQFNK